MATTMDWSPTYVATNLNMIAESFYIPKRNSAKPHGEDAHFISQADNMIGVADGVGGWAKKGIDSGKYARSLMFNARVSACNRRKTHGFVDHPKTILSEAYEKTDEQGSSTACILSLREQYLHCANVGDSKFVVIRAGKVVLQSRVQQKGFNCPYQLGRMEGSNSPEDADVYVGYKVEEGDIIVMGTDGLFDNVDEMKLEEMVKYGRYATLGCLAKEIAMFARKQSEDSTAYTPYERAACLAGDGHRGGKYDDVTVIVACVYK